MPLLSTLPLLQTPNPQLRPQRVQARILSFLAYDHMRFCSRRLSNLARDVLSDGEEVEFWVKRAARQLLDKVSDSSYEWVSGFNLDSEEEQINNNFESVPEWLKNAARNDDLLLPWLPISTNEINIRVPLCSNEDADDPMLVVEEEKKEYSNNNGTGIDNARPKTDPLDPEIVKTATSMETRVLNFESTSKSVELANEICQICDKGVDSLAVLGIIEPWKVDDEVLRSRQRQVQRYWLTCRVKKTLHDSTYVIGWLQQSPAYVVDGSD